MPVSEEDIQKLEAKIVGGTAEVRDGARSVRLRTVEELIAARKFAERQTAQAAGSRRVRRIRAQAAPSL